MKIPKMDSIEELARFWDSHDMTDFAEDMEESKSSVFRRSDVVRVPLTPAEHEALRRLAATRGVDEAVLVHQWVQEKLRGS